MSFDVRIRLTPTERVQWEADTDRIHHVVGQLPNKHVIMWGVHTLARMIDYLGLLDQLDQLDKGALAALVNGTQKETDK